MLTVARGGKSTHLRTTALIVLLAQAGAFVPASYARIGVVDAIFTRIGARDDLYRANSTFMIEMVETARILRKATPRSLVRQAMPRSAHGKAILDEVGRGTSASDGLAISYGVVDHLARVNQCRTLFATHAHELSRLFSNRRDVAFFCTELEPAGDRVRPSTHMQPG